MASTDPSDDRSGATERSEPARLTANEELERELGDLQALLLRRIEEVNGRFNLAQEMVAEAQRRLVTIGELRAEAQDVLDAARAEAAEIVAQAHAERDLTAMHIDHHVETGRAMAALETTEIVRRSVARARESANIAIETLKRLQVEMDRHVEHEVRER